MTVLRVLLAAEPAADRAETWALFDDAGACVRKGRDRSTAWPSADRLEIVLAASQVRIAAIALPPMPASRVAGAAGFSLEDQLAGPDSAHHVAVSAQAPDGRVRVAITSQSLLAAILAYGPNVARIVAEPDLAAPSAAWTWCARESSAAGFVRRPDGSALPVDAPEPSGILPAELVLALTQARRGNPAPLRVRVDAPFDEPSLARWQRDTGVEFIRGTPWQWESATPAAFTDAIELMPRADRKDVASTGVTAGRVLAPALVIAGLALGLHVAASTAEWATLKMAAWRDAKEWTALATAAGVAPDLATTPAAARLALSLRYAEWRHTQGLPAPDDALPLLARAAPALAALPTGAVKSATYADGHWTLDVGLADAAAVGAIDQRLRGAGVPALVAASPSGARMRLGGS
jgi:Type II secretion system (T2SS), protein L